MARVLYVCRECKKQIDKVFHHGSPAAETIPCPSCGKPVGQFKHTLKESPIGEQSMLPARKTFERKKKGRRR